MQIGSGGIIMPDGDGTGPFEQRYGRGKTLEVGKRPGMGPGGDCVCPDCGQKNPHQAGIPCTEVKCQNCETAMLRDL